MHVWFILLHYCILQQKTKSISSFISYHSVCLVSLKNFFDTVKRQQQNGSLEEDRRSCSARQAQPYTLGNNPHALSSSLSLITVSSPYLWSLCLLLFLICSLSWTHLAGKHHLQFCCCFFSFLQKFVAIALEERKLFCFWHWVFFWSCCSTWERQ